MTGDPPVLDRPALWAALSHMRIEIPGGARFEEALAARQGWTTGFAERVADEYCGFLYLASTAGFEVTPSRAVDEAWHLHLSLPHYRETLCGRILGRPLEHRPASGLPDDEARCRLQYEETLALYERVFGKRPPGDIWPSPAGDAQDGAENRDDPEDSAERGGGRRLSRRTAFAALFAAIAALASGASTVAIVLACAALLFFMLGLPTTARGRESGGSCGAGYGGGSASSGDDCGASCGGGGCGGGCGGD
jgi:hypothetical protein